MTASVELESNRTQAPTTPVTYDSSSIDSRISEESAKNLISSKYLPTQRPPLSENRELCIGPSRIDRDILDALKKCPPFEISADSRSASDSSQQQAAHTHADRITRSNSAPEHRSDILLKILAAADDSIDDSALSDSSVCRISRRYSV